MRWRNRSYSWVVNALKDPFHFFYSLSLVLTHHSPILNLAEANLILTTKGLAKSGELFMKGRCSPRLFSSQTLPMR